MFFKIGLLLIFIFCITSKNILAQEFFRKIFTPWITSRSIPAFQQPEPGDQLKFLIDRVTDADRRDLVESNEVLPQSFTEQDRRLVRFYLHPNPAERNFTEEIIPWDELTLKESQYNTNLNLVLIIHGFLGSDNLPQRENEVIRNAFFDAGNPVNIIGVDWGRVINRFTGNRQSIINLGLYYTNVAPEVFNVMTVVSDLILFLTQSHFLKGPEQVQIVGFSLGAQLAGLVGQDIQRRTGRKIKRISGLDPAGPLFNGLDEDRRLSSDDAEFVDVTHTNQAFFGYIGRAGHVDWFINGGGPSQPGCSLAIQSQIDTRCQHERAFYFFADSIRYKKYFGCRCEANQCQKIVKEECRDALYGQYTNLRKRGSFYVEIPHNPLTVTPPYNL